MTNPCKLICEKISVQLSTWLIILFTGLSSTVLASGYSSSSVAQITGNVSPSSNDQQVLVVTVDGNSSGIGQNWQISTCSFTMSNTNNSNVTAAKLWINSTNTFTGATQAGSTINNPSGTIIFTVSSGNIGNNTRYLFLTFNISASAPCSGNTIDAFVPTSGLVITGNNAGNKTPTNNNPTGNRAIFLQVTPSISITSTGNGNCQGSTIAFNSTINNGGPTPNYQWKVNGINTGSNSNNFSSTSLSNNDQVLCVLTSDATCAIPASISSNSITAIVLPKPHPVIYPKDTVLCTGIVIKVTARDSGFFQGGYPPGTLFDYGFGPSTDSTLLVNGPGFYAVTVTLPSGYGSCNGTSGNPNINYIDAPVAILNATEVNCNGETSATINAQIYLGTVPFHFKWYHNGYIIKDTISSEAYDTLANVGVGSYYLVVLDSIAGNQNGLTCASDSAFINVTGPGQIMINHSINNISCQGGNDGSIGILISGGTSPYTFLWSNGQTTGNLSLLTDGTYTLTVTDAHGCNLLNSYSVSTIPDISHPVLNCPANIFVNEDTGQCSAIVNYATPVGTDNCPGVHTMQTSGLASGSAFPIGTTMNTFIATDSVGNTTLCSFTVSVTDNLPPVITCSPDIQVNNDPGSCGAIVTYSAPLVSDDCSISSNIQTSGLPSASLFPVGITTNTFQVTDGGGNISTCSFSVRVIDNYPPIISCINDTVLVNNPGSAGATFDYIIPYSDNCNVTLSQTSGLASGSLFPVGTTLNSFTATDASGNISYCSFSVTVLDNELPIVLCQHISLLLNPDGTLLLDPIMIDAGSHDNCGIGSRSVSPNTFTCSNVGENPVILTVNDIHGNISTCSTTITISSSLTAQILPTPVQLCAGNSTILSGNPTGGSGTYFMHSWSGDNLDVSDTTLENTNFNSTVPGIFNLVYTVTDDKGCIASDQATIEVFSGLSANISQTNVNCYNGNDGHISVSVTGGSGNLSYLWSNGSSSAAVSGLSAGTYTVTISDAAGCTITMNSTLTEPQSLDLSTGVTNAGCFNAQDGTITVSASGGTGAYTYLWSNGQSTVSAISLAPGTYTVTVTDLNGCTKTISATVNPLTITAILNSGVYTGGYNLTCAGGNNGSIDLTILNGTGPYSYLWNNGATTEDLSGLAAGAYTVTVSNSYCNSDNVIVLSQPPALQTSISKTNVSCFGSNNGTASATVSGGLIPYNYLWNTLPAKTISSISNLAPGNYSLTVTDINGCQLTSSISITQPTVLTATGVITNLKCKGDNDGSILLSPNGGTPPYTYIWNTGNTTKDRTGLKSKTYTVTVTDTHGCTKKSTFNVTEPSNVLQIVTNKTNVRCYNGNTGIAGVSVMGGVAPYSYSWNTIPVATTSNIVNLFAGTYSCVVTDAAGCAKTVSLVITQPALMILTTSQSNVTTHGGHNGTASVSVGGGTPGFSYMWNTAPIKTTSNINNLVAGTYTVKVIDSKGCSKTALVVITQPSLVSKSSEFKSSPDQNISVFPNPGDGFVSVRFENITERELNLSLFDVLGNSVYSDKISLTGKHEPADYDFRKLPKGIYLMEMKGNTFRKTLKIIIQ